MTHIKRKDDDISLCIVVVLLVVRTWLRQCSLTQWPYASGRGGTTTLVGSTVACPAWEKVGALLRGMVWCRSSCFSYEGYILYGLKKRKEGRKRGVVGWLAKLVSRRRFLPWVSRSKACCSCCLMVQKKCNTYSCQRMPLQP